MLKNPFLDLPSFFRGYHLPQAALLLYPPSVINKVPMGTLSLVINISHTEGKKFIRPTPYMQGVTKYEETYVRAPSSTSVVPV